MIFLFGEIPHWIRPDGRAGGTDGGNGKTYRKFTTLRVLSGKERVLKVGARLGARPTTGTTYSGDHNASLVKVPHLFRDGFKKTLRESLVEKYIGILEHVSLLFIRWALVPGYGGCGFDAAHS